MSDYKPSNEFEDQIREAVRVSDASPEFVGRLRGELARMPVKPKPRFILRPAWALAIVLVIVVIAASAPRLAAAVRQWFGYVPGIGLVEQNSPLRMLAAPVSATRDGVTLTLEQVLVYADRIELAYSAAGIPAAAPGAAAETCGGADSYPSLRLPDGTLLEPDPMLLGGTVRGSGYNAGHSYSAAVPPEVTSATFLLACLQNAQRGAAPEQWALPFDLVNAPEGLTPEGVVVGSPVDELPQPVETRGVGIEFTPVGGAWQEDGYHLFFRFSMRSDHPDFLTVRPHAMYIIDASGAKIDLINTLPWSPFDAVDVWEYRTAMPPAQGPMSLVVDGAEVYYLAQNASFEFAPGPDPRMGQTWDLDRHFTIGGQAVTVRSARMTEMETHKGFEFTIQADEPGVKISAEVLDMTPTDPHYSMWSTTGFPAPDNIIITGFVYADAVPETLRVTFNTISVQLDYAAQIDWTPGQ